MEEEKNRGQEDIFDKAMALPGLNYFWDIYRKYKEVLLYLFFGGLTCVLSIGSYSYLVIAGMNPLYANVISWILAVTFAYGTNKIWVFDAETHGVRELFREASGFFAGRVFTLVVEELILFIFITRLAFNEVAVKVAAQVVVTVLNYVISKLLVFRDKD